MAQLHPTNIASTVFAPNVYPQFPLHLKSYIVYSLGTNRCNYVRV